jgi:cell division protein FtsL
VKRLAAVGHPRVFALLVAVLWLTALASAAGAIWMKHRSRELFVELERANARRDNLEIEWGQLQLEQSAWSTHAFVERVAGTKLHMAMPPPQDIQILAQPVVSTPPPAAARASAP